MDYNYEDYLASLVSEVKKEKKINYEETISVKKDIEISASYKDNQKGSFVSKESIKNNEKYSKEISFQINDSNRNYFVTSEIKNNEANKAYLPIETVIIEEYKSPSIFNVNDINSYSINKYESNMYHQFGNLEKEDRIISSLDKFEISFDINDVDENFIKNFSSTEIDLTKQRPNLSLNITSDYITTSYDETKKDSDLNITRGYIEARPNLSLNTTRGYIETRPNLSLNNSYENFVSPKAGTTIINAGGAISQSLEGAYGNYSNLQSDLNNANSTVGLVSSIAKELEFQFSSVTDKGIESWLSNKVGKITNYPSWSYRAGFEAVSDLFNGFVKLGQATQQSDPSTLINSAISAFDFRNVMSLGNPFSSKERYNKGRHDLLINEKNTAGVFDSKVPSKGSVLISGLSENKIFTLNPLFLKLEEGVDGKYKDTIDSQKPKKDFNIKERFIANKDMVDSNNDTIPDVNADTIIENLNKKKNEQYTGTFVWHKQPFYIEDKIKLEEGVDGKYKDTIDSQKPKKDFNIKERFIANKDMVDSNNDTIPDVNATTIIENLNKKKNEKYTNTFIQNKPFFYIKGKIKTTAYNKEKELVDLYSEINNSTITKSIGYIYVNPVYADIIRSGSKLIKIPIQTNLKISGDNLRAEYNKIDFLNRIGSVAQYTRTESRTAEIETSYFVETTDTSKGRYTMKDLQNIEYLYKSLLVPQRVSEMKNGKSFNYMTRPPVINIVIGYENSNNDIKITNDEAFKNGSSFDKSTIINNFFTYPIVENLESGKDSGKLYYRSFVATDLSIEKETDTSTFYIERGIAKDYSGFSVKLSLLEIDPNYLGVNPTFDDYALFGTRGIEFKS